MTSVIGAVLTPYNQLIITHRDCIQLRSSHNELVASYKCIAMDTGVLEDGRVVITTHRMVKILSMNFEEFEVTASRWVGSFTALSPCILSVGHGRVLVSSLLDDIVVYDEYLTLLGHIVPPAYIMCPPIVLPDYRIVVPTAFKTYVYSEFKLVSSFTTPCPSHALVTSKGSLCLISGSCLYTYSLCGSVLGVQDLPMGVISAISSFEDGWLISCHPGDLYLVSQNHTKHLGLYYPCKAIHTRGSTVLLVGDFEDSILGTLEGELLSIEQVLPCNNAPLWDMSICRSPSHESIYLASGLAKRGRITKASPGLEVVDLAEAVCIPEIWTCTSTHSVYLPWIGKPCVLISFPQTSRVLDASGSLDDVTRGSHIDCSSSIIAITEFDCGVAVVYDTRIDFMDRQGNAMWSQQTGSTIQFAGFDKQNSIIYCCSGSSLFSLNLSSEILSSLLIPEATCMEVHNNFVIIGTFTKSCIVLEGCQIVSTTSLSGIPESIVVFFDTVYIGTRTGELVSFTTSKLGSIIGQMVSHAYCDSPLKLCTLSQTQSIMFSLDNTWIFSISSHFEVDIHPASSSLNHILHAVPLSPSGILCITSDSELRIVEIISNDSSFPIFTEGVLELPDTPHCVFSLECLQSLLILINKKLFLSPQDLSSLSVVTNPQLRGNFDCVWVSDMHMVCGNDSDILVVDVSTLSILVQWSPGIEVSHISSHSMKAKPDYLHIVALSQTTLQNWTVSRNLSTVLVSSCTIPVHFNVRTIRSDGTRFFLLLTNGLSIAMDFPITQLSDPRLVPGSPFTLPGIDAVSTISEKLTGHYLGDVLHATN